MLAGILRTYGRYNMEEKPMSEIKRCIIITSYIETTIRTNVNIRPDDYVICADGGFKHAVRENITPQVVIGDFDSYPHSEAEAIINSLPEYSHVEIMRTIPEKDDTDTMMCIKYGFSKGFKDYIIIGGLGGRLDHTMANIQALSYIIDNGGSAWIMDGHNKATMIKGPAEIELTGEPSSYFSIYSYTEKCTGIYEINAKYPLDDATLTQSNPMGTSNEFLDGNAAIKVENGKLLVIISD